MRAGNSEYGARCGARAGQHPEVGYGAKSVVNRLHFEKLIARAGTWNEWRVANPGIIPDLSHVSLDSRPEAVWACEWGADQSQRCKSIQSRLK